jgi:hypothetical protein
MLCGQKGHIAANCPKQRTGTMKASLTKVTVTISTPTSRANKMKLYLQLLGSRDFDKCRTLDRTFIRSFARLRSIQQHLMFEMQSPCASQDSPVLIALVRPSGQARRRLWVHSFLFRNKRRSSPIVELSSNLSNSRNSSSSLQWRSLLVHYDLVHLHCADFPTQLFYYYLRNFLVLEK